MFWKCFKKSTSSIIYNVNDSNLDVTMNVHDGLFRAINSVNNRNGFLGTFILDTIIPHSPNREKLESHYTLRLYQHNNFINSEVECRLVISTDEHYMKIQMVLESPDELYYCIIDDQNDENIICTDNYNYTIKKIRMQSGKSTKIYQHIKVFNTYPNETVSSCESSEDSDSD